MARLPILVLAFSAAASVSALPHWGHRGGWDNWNWHPWSNGNWGRDSTPTLPLSEADNSGASPLPTPTTSVQYVLLGVGFQNYSCASTGTYVQNVPASGAIADLYDITKNINANTKDTITKNVLKAFEICLAWTKCTPSDANGFCGQCHQIAAAPYRNKFVGEHFFDQVNGAQSPNFNVWSKGSFLSAKKSGSISAPASAYKGANGLGTVGWLYLTANGSERTKGLTSVYRVETAGGVAPSTCSQPGATLQVPYTAEYWFYN